MSAPNDNSNKKDPDEEPTLVDGLEVSEDTDANMSVPELELSDITPPPRTLPLTPGSATFQESQKVSLQQKSAAKATPPPQAPTPPELRFKIPEPKVEKVSVSKVDAYAIAIVVVVVIGLGSSPFFIDFVERSPAKILAEGASARLKLKTSPISSKIKVTLDGYTVTPDADSLINVPYGEPHSLQVSLDGFDSHSQEVAFEQPQNMDAADIRTLNIELNPRDWGSITVNSNPSCAVEVSGGSLTYRLRTPVQKLRVPVGRYDVTFVEPANCPEKTYNVEISAQDKAIVELDTTLVPVKR